MTARAVGKPPRLRVDWPRRSRQLILVLLTILAVACAGMVVGAWWDDRSIDAGTGHAVAEVRAVDTTRTTVDFIDETGEYRSPPRGIRYPVGLAEGDRVRIEYDRGNPDVARVAGRRWTLAILPATSVFIVGVLIAIPLWWLTVRATRRKLDDSTGRSPGAKGK